MRASLLETGNGSHRPPRPAPQAPGDLSRGATIGRYIVLEQLGIGAMGVVLLAYDPELDRRVALKLIKPSAWAGPESDLRSRLRREARAMARLAHPNVVAVYDVG
ncbi:MAG TPA: serine/threonine protein kinase, partial [Myxococcales bacterium]|nr:serine/threonine protein kinase [Myxococcales bacterium]